jgi:hypothetical protein
MIDNQEKHLTAMRNRVSDIVLVAAAILLTQDFDRPNSGFIRVSQQPMIDTAASVRAYAD